jgi:acyl-CoA synthetase (NDP forming)
MRCINIRISHPRGGAWKDPRVQDTSFPLEVLVKFTAFFRPKTLAVIGVSLTNDRHPANVVYNKNNLRYQAEVFAVNERGGTFQGQPVYKHISEVPGKVNLAVIATRAELVPTIVADCIQADVDGAVIISGGFAESGRRDLQETITSLAREADFPVIGPNCLGIYSPPFIDTLFIPSERMVRPERGRVALVSQSGGLLADQMVKFAAEGVGLSTAVSIGNKALIGEIELLRYFSNDPETGVVAFYVEGFGKDEGREFVKAATRCPKPVIVLKSGKTPGGTRAVSSHTASMAGDYDVFSAVLRQYGIVEAKNEFELGSFCEGLSCYHRPIEGRIGIITASGGHGALAADACFSHGLSVPALSARDQEEMRERLSPRVRAIASYGNPIDLTGSAVDDDFLGAAQIFSTKEEIDCVLILLLPYVPGITSDLGARLSQVYRETDKPLIAYVPHVEKYRMFIEGFELNRIPVAHSIEGAVHMAEAMRRYRPW